MSRTSFLAVFAFAVAGAGVGLTTQHFASAGTSSGERPVLISITPCRLVDTRPAPNTTGPRSAPLAAGDTMTVDAQEAGVDCSGQIPTDASALSLNITALGATELSFLTVWPGGERPLAASLNPAPGQPPVPNAVTTALSVDQEFEVYNDAGNVNIVIDVNGYYLDHDHDDRYYTQTQADARFVMRETTIDVPPSGFHPVDNGWRLDGFFIARVFGETGSKCAYAPIDLAPGDIVTKVAVTYQNFALPADLVLSVTERSLEDDRAVGGTQILAAAIPLPSYSSDLTVGHAESAPTEATAASALNSHQVKMCTTNDRVYIDGLQLTVSTS